MSMIEVRETETYAKWFKGLRDQNAKAARIDIRIRRVSLGNFGDVKSVGEGVRELRVDYGPRLPRLFRAARRYPRDPALRRRQAHARQSHQGRQALGANCVGERHGHKDHPVGPR